MGSTGVPLGAILSLSRNRLTFSTLRLVPLLEDIFKVLKGKTVSHEY